MNDSLNYYELLGINETANDKEIKEAYKKQIKKWHPDINKSEDSTFMSVKINEAKEILLDLQKRTEYDLYLKEIREQTFEKHFKKEEQETTSQKKYPEDIYRNITKWDYLWEWLRCSKTSLFRKFLGLIGVFLESIFCTILNLSLVIISLLSYFATWLLNIFSEFFLGITGIVFIVFIIYLITEGFHAFSYIDRNDIIFILSVIFILVFTKFLSWFQEFIISERVFTFLYQKLNINLFKFCVGYNKES